MSEESAVKLKPFSGKEEEWVYWAPMFLSHANTKGYLSGNQKYRGFPPLAATRRTRGFSNGKEANDPNEDGPNNLFERFELRDKNCDCYCCYCCVWF